VGCDLTGVDSLIGAVGRGAIELALSRGVVTSSGLSATAFNWAKKEEMGAGAFLGEGTDSTKTTARLQS
jgi:hypothetical protein